MCIYQTDESNFLKNLWKKKLNGLKAYEQLSYKQYQDDIGKK